MSEFTVVEVCAGAGGQSLGLHRAGFEHVLAVEIDALAAETLQNNLGVKVAVGDAADIDVWNPADYEGVTLLAGGVPCPPFSIAGKQLGSADERDLFAWAIEQVGIVRPRAVMLENVRGLAGPKFSGYRQWVLNRLREFGYEGDWKLLTSADYGVPQLRPRFVLVAMKPEDMRHFHWPSPTVATHVSVGTALKDLMAAGGWKHADEWSRLADGVGPTIVGGSKKHGGADLGPTRAKQGWAKLFVDGKGVLETPPSADHPSPHEQMPRLTIEMVTRVQGWTAEDRWEFAGRKTAQYRQIGNAFPPPVAEAVGRSIADALNRAAPAKELSETKGLHDPVYRALASSPKGLTMAEIAKKVADEQLSTIERSVAALKSDFEVEAIEDPAGTVRYRLGEFKAFTGQPGHKRHDFVLNQTSKVS